MTPAISERVATEDGRGVEAVFDAWEREDRYHREYSFQALIREAVGPLMRGSVHDDLRAIRSTLNSRPRPKQKASPAKIARRAKAKAGHKANVRRRSA